MRLARVITILLPLFSFVGLELIIIKSAWFFYILVAMNVLLVISLYFFLKTSHYYKSFFRVLVLPLFLLNSTVLYISVLTNSSLRQLVNALFLVILFIFLRNLYIYLFKPLKYSLQSLENINFFASFLILFYIMKGVLSLQSFVNIETWQILLLMFVVIFVLLLQLFWFHKIKLKNNFLFSTLLTLSLVEIIYASIFLPQTYSIIALFVAIVFYVIVGLCLFYLKFKLNKRLLKMYIGLFLIALIVIFLSSRWI